MDNILILGGAGYIGSHAVYKLIEENYNVIVLDNLQTGHKEAISPKAKFYKGDIRNIKDVQSVFRNEKIDGVLHFAASSLVGESMLNPLKYYDNNVNGTKIILETMHDFNVNNIVFSSTAAVYGKTSEIPITENTTTEPYNTYGETKLAVENMMKWCSIAHNIKYVSLRYFNVAGAMQGGNIGEAHNPETHLIPLVLKVALGLKDNILVFGDDYNTKDGTCIRDYIHVEDLIDAHILALKYLCKGGKSDIFNLGSSQGFSVNEIINTAKQITNHNIKAINSPRRVGDPPTLIACSEKAKKILGWNPKRTSINQIIEDAWQWHKSHPNGY